MNPKIVVTLLVVLLLACVAFIITRGEATSGVNEPNPPARDQTAEAIVDPESLGPRLSSLTLDFGSESDDIELARVQGQWRVDEPHAFPANGTEIDKVLNALTELTGAPTEDKTLPSRPIGVTLDHGSDRHSIWLGKRTGSGQAIVYRQTKDGIQSFLTGDVLHDLFAALDPKQFYAKQFDPLLMPEICEVHISTPDSVAELRQEDGRWWIVYGDKAERALAQTMPDHFGVNSYFELFRQVELIEQHPYQGNQALAQYGLDKPLITARFVPMLEELENANTGWLLRVGVPADPEDKTRFVSFGWSGNPTPAVFTVATPLALAFAQNSTAFRDPRIVTTPREMIASIRLRYSGGPTQTIDLSSTKNPIYRQSDGQTLALSAERVAKTLVRLVDVRSMDFVLAKLSEGFSEGNILVSVEVIPRLNGKPERFDVYTDPQRHPDRPTVLIHRGVEPAALRVPLEVVTGFIDPTILQADDQQ